MLRSVLAGVDSKSVSYVLDRLASLPLRSDATLTILSSGGVSELEVCRALRRVGRIRWISGRVSSRALLEEAERVGAELVVTGPAGLFGCRIRTIVGRRPVLVVRRDSPASYRRAVVATDPDGNAALVFAHRLLSVSEVEVCAVHATRSVAEGRQLVAQSLATLGPFAATRYIETGNSSSATVSAARTARADLVIIAAPYRSLAAKVLLGSAVTNVLRDAACDVLVVPITSTVTGHAWRRLWEAYEQRA